MNQATVRLKPCTSAGKTNHHARQVILSNWRKQRRFAVWKGGWMATILFLASVTAHASPPQFFHIITVHPTAERYIQKLHELERREIHRKVVKQ